MSGTCQCRGLIAIHLSEPGIVAIIQAYIAELRRPVDIIRRLLEYGDQGRHEFGYNFQYALHRSELFISNPYWAAAIIKVNTHGIADALASEVARATIHKILDEDPRADNAFHKNFDTYIDIMSQDLREYSTPRCQHDIKK